MRVSKNVFASEYGIRLAQPQVRLQDPQGDVALKRRGVLPLRLCTLHRLELRPFEGAFPHCSHRRDGAIRRLPREGQRIAGHVAKARRHPSSWQRR